MSAAPGHVRTATQRRVDYWTQCRIENVMARLLFRRTAVDVHKGLTTTAQRMAAIRTLILREKLETEIIGRPSGQLVTWSMAFERAYGEPLTAVEALL